MTGPAHPDWNRLGADWPNRENSHFRQVEDVRWHYQRMGAGSVLLLLHGAGAATHTWRDLMPLLARYFDVIAPDLPGHGFTRTVSRQRCALPPMADGLVTLLSELGVEPETIVGHSAGAAVGLKMVLDGEATPSVVIGLNPALAPFRGLAGVLFPPLARALTLNPLVPWVFSSLAGNAGRVKKLIDGTGSEIDARGLELYARMISRRDHVDGALSMMATWDLKPLLDTLPGIEVPTHLIVGLADRTVPPGEARALAARIPKIMLHEVQDLGHLMHEEAPERFAEMIVRVAGEP